MTTNGVKSSCINDLGQCIYPATTTAVVERPYLLTPDQSLGGKTAIMYRN
jgi:hypothetical protein